MPFMSEFLSQAATMTKNTLNQRKKAKKIKKSLIVGWPL